MNGRGVLATGTSDFRTVTKGEVPTPLQTWQPVGEPCPCCLLSPASVTFVKFGKGVKRVRLGAVGWKISSGGGEFHVHSQLLRSKES